MSEPVYLETSPKWSYAVAVEWPGWARHARVEADPIEDVLDCGPRCGAVLATAGIAFEAPADLEVVAVHDGNSGTE